jgi:hypothetical protein
LRQYLLPPWAAQPVQKWQKPSLGLVADNALLTFVVSSFQHAFSALTRS